MPKSVKKLQLSRTDRKLTGLCGGIGDYFDVDPAVVRLIMLGATVVTAIMPGVMFYIIASLIIPSEGN